MASENYPPGIPTEFRRYFWDVEFEKLMLDENSRFIAERILNYGDLSGIKWLLSWADEQFIRNIRDNSRNLNAKTKNFWKLIL